MNDANELDVGWAWGLTFAACALVVLMLHLVMVTP